MDFLVTLRGSRWVCAAVVDLMLECSRNFPELLVKRFRAMDQTVQVLALRCWRVLAFSILSLPKRSPFRKQWLAQLLTSG